MTAVYVILLVMCVLATLANLVDCLACLYEGEFILTVWYGSWGALTGYGAYSLAALLW
jgi:hypothetical protein